MGGIFKGAAKAVGSLLGKKPSQQAQAAPAGVQPTAPAAAAMTAPAEGLPTAPGATGTMGATGAKKSTGRRRGRMETLLGELGGTFERFGD